MLTKKSFTGLGRDKLIALILDLQAQVEGFEREKPPYREDMARIAQTLGLADSLADIGHILGCIDEMIANIKKREDKIPPRREDIAKVAQSLGLADQVDANVLAQIEAIKEIEELNKIGGK